MYSGIPAPLPQAMAPYAHEDEYFRNNYNTPLNAQEQAKYKQWIPQSEALHQRPLTDDNIDYDMQGYAKSLGFKPWQPGHGVDTFKKPNHMTFSDQSRYHGTPDPVNGGANQGGHWFSTAPQIPAYQPSVKSAAYQGAERMKNYFQKYEPDYQLMEPK
jgi:hypothetical protein